MRVLEALLCAMVLAVACSLVWPLHGQDRPLIYLSGTSGTPVSLASAAAPGDADAGNTSLPAVVRAWNGATQDRLRTASLTNFPLASTLTARNSIGALISEKGSRWMVISNPASGSQATASIAAEAAVRHVADCISFSGDSSAAVTATALTVNLRDGASGAGSVIWAAAVAAVTAAGAGVQNVAPFSICGLNLVGTTNTAMTLEFTAGVVGLVEAVSISGYNVS